MTAPYYEAADLVADLGANAIPASPVYELAVDAARQWIDDHCSDYPNGLVRRFWRDPEPVTRLVVPRDPWIVDVGDFDVTDDDEAPVVEVDPSGTGTWQPVPADQWRPEPVFRGPGWPYTRIVRASHTGRWPLGLGSRVRFTARSGWAAPPAPVVMANRVLAVTGMLGTDVVANEGMYAASSNQADPFVLAEGLLKPYRLADPGMSGR